MRLKSWRRLLAGAALALALGQGRNALAASSATINLDVTILATLSVSVNALASSTETSINWDTGNPNQRIGAASTVTVRNDSGGLTERWALSTNPGSLNVGGGSDVWSLDTSTDTLPGADQYTVQAVFGSSNTLACPAGAASDWDQGYAKPLTTGPQVYGSTGDNLFADPNLNNAGTPDPDVPALDRVWAGSQRALCWRLIMPASTSVVETQNIQITVTALLP